MKFIILSKEDLYRMIACFILGLITGAILVNIIMGYKYDELLLTNQNLLIELEENQQRLKTLEKDTNGIPVVNKVILKLNSKEDRYTEQALEKEIMKLLTGLVGLKIYELDTTILRDILHNRTFLIDEKTYQLAVETIIVDDELTFIIKVNKISKNSLSDEE